MINFTNTWLPFIYLYVVGGLFFLSGMIIVKKANAVNFDKKRHRYWWNVTIFGFFYFMAIHAFFIILALYS
ncbi:MAG: hypothetical protein WAR79_12840 [Melioribacteraceae bacterium]